MSVTLADGAAVRPLGAVVLSNYMGMKTVRDSVTELWADASFLILDGLAGSAAIATIIIEERCSI